MTETVKPNASESLHGAMIDRAAVYEELAELAQIIPGIHRDLFCYRWGLNGHTHHLQKDAIRRFELAKSAVETRLEWCLWSVAREAHRRKLPAIRALLGADQDAWAARAWTHADRWEHASSQVSETALLLAVGGLDVAEARARAATHGGEVGVLGCSNGAVVPSYERRLAEAAAAVDKIVAHVIWPSTANVVADLSGFSVNRELAIWSRGRNGYFHSDKLNRPIQFESTLELAILKHLDHDPRVREFVEQPLTIPYTLDRQTRSYTPDVAVRLDDGRVFVMEIKPPKGLGQFAHWMRWASLARWCGQRGYGLYVGSPERSVIDHHALKVDADTTGLVVDAVGTASVTGGDYDVLTELVGSERIGLVACSEMLDWRPDRRIITAAAGADREEASRLWRLIDVGHEVAET